MNHPVCYMLFIFLISALRKNSTCNSFLETIPVSAFCYNLRVNEIIILIFTHDSLYGVQIEFHSSIFLSPEYFNVR